MAYVKTVWQDRVVEKPLTYKLMNNSDGTVTLTPNEGQIISVGVPLTATNLNKMEQGIFDRAEKTLVKTATLSTTWTGTGPFTQVVAVSGVTVSNNIEVGLAQTATKAQIEAAGSAMLMATAQGTNSITVTAYGEKPTVVIPLTVLILG